MNSIFFGSTTDSVIVLEKLVTCHLSLVTLRVSAVVTQPPKPVGRKQILTPTPVEAWAKTHDIPVLSFPSNPSAPSLFADDQVVIDTLQPFKPDLLISASFGQRIPWEFIAATKFGGLNVHPSLLPRWRGADPVPWAIMSGDAQTGVTIVTLSEDFDSGTIVVQKKVPITEKDFSDPLRTQLFELGAELLVDALPKYLTKNLSSRAQSKDLSDKHPYARRLTRDDGFESWKTIQKAFEDEQEAIRIDRKFRALTPWPGLWTEVSVRQRINVSAQKKRIKIISLHRRTSGNDAMTLVLDTVQLEGKKPVSWKQFQSAYLLPS